MSAEEPAESQPVEPSENSGGPVRLRVRRRPRLLPFLLTGAVFGVIVGAFVASRPPKGTPLATYSESTATGYVMVLCAGLGLLLGALVFVLVDAADERKRTRQPSGAAESTAHDAEPDA